MTRAACGEGSRFNEFVQALERIDSFTFEDGQLNLDPSDETTFIFDATMPESDEATPTAGSS